MADESEQIYEGAYVRVCRRGGWEFVERANARGAVIIVAATAVGEVILVEQPRAPVAANVIEYPAGLVGDQAGAEEESLEVAAARELEEETGYRAGRLEFLTAGPPTAGLAAETTWWFLARDLDSVGAGGGDDSEQITVHCVPRVELEHWLVARRDAGVLIDPKVYAGLYFLDRA